jgi:ABC-type Co2+ transport system permease subunit
LLGDGGIVALGVNITNMALLPAASLALLNRATKQRLPAIGAVCVLSVALAVVLIGGEVALGRSASELSSWSTFVGAMLTNHLPLLPLEVGVTVGLVALAQSEKVDQRPVWRVPAMAVVTAVIVGLIAIVASSSLPDGYESAAAIAQMKWLLGE